MSAYTYSNTKYITYTRTTILLIFRFKDFTKLWRVPHQYTSGIPPPKNTTTTPTKSATFTTAGCSSSGSGGKSVIGHRSLEMNTARYAYVYTYIYLYLCILMCLHVHLPVFLCVMCSILITMSVQL